ncbi:MAG: GNAT family N-acetyltransferase [Clostridia bacterium]|nr:GNAT family N-acetyltransferase [Clostridia bacterium]
MIIRKTNFNDVGLLVKLRMDYLLNQNKEDSLGNIEKLQSDLFAYFQKSIEDQNFLAIVAEENNIVYSTAFLSIADRPPRTSNESSRIGTIYNVYTYPQYRKQGVATKVVEALCEEASLFNISTIDLYASNEGKPLYERLGFQIPYHTYMKKKV